MKTVRQFFLLIVVIFLVACGSSSEKGIDDIPESYIDGVEDLGEHFMNTAKIVYGEDGKEDMNASSYDDYDLKSLTIINSKQEFEAVKYFLEPDDIQRLESIDFSKKTLLFASMIYRSGYVSPPHISIKKIEKKIIHDGEERIHCAVYRSVAYDRIAMTDRSAIYHAYTIPKTKSEYITYDVFDLDK